MGVYVDKPIHKYGRMIMCHMIADSNNELLVMADKIGVPLKWFQDKRIPHFDICKAKRELALGHGAIEVSSKELIMIARHSRRRMIQLTSPVPCEAINNYE